MPNGGSDCCGNCKFNNANKKAKVSGIVSYCVLRKVIISSPFWTYCKNFFYPNSSRIDGPIYSSGIYDNGYSRIPWNDVFEPITYVSGTCCITGKQFTNGIRVYENSVKDYLYFANNDIYLQWLKNKKIISSNNLDLAKVDEVDKNDLHSIYTMLFRKNYLSVDFIHFGKEITEIVSDLTSAEIKDKSRGVMIGGAIGDALGRQVEGKQPGTYWIEEYEKWRGWTSGAIGTITDDTQMTIILAESLIANDGLNPETLAESFTQKKYRRIGNTMKVFIRNYKDLNMPWFLSGIESSGNGVAMRSSPLGLFYLNKPEQIKLASGIQAMITHNDPMAIASGIVVASMIYSLFHIQKDSLYSIESKIKFCQNIAEIIDGIEDVVLYTTRNGGYGSSVRRRIKNDIPKFLKENISPKEVNDIFWSGAYVLESLPFAIYCFLYSPNDFRETLINSVNFSRDSDTVASIACSFSGAYNGIHSMEEYFIQNLEYKDYLLELADRILPI